MKYGKKKRASKSSANFVNNFEVIDEKSEIWKINQMMKVKVLEITFSLIFRSGEG